jgi:thymidylate synthase (FAD)
MPVRLLAITTPVNDFVDQETIIEFAARTCYNSTNKLGTNDRFIESIMKRGHLSTIEHISFTFEISGITRACANQLVRHRLASYSQESTRYVDMSTQNVIEPDAIKNHPYCHVLWISTVKIIRRVYNEFRKHGIKKEDARAILPLNLETKLMASMNARELMHVIELRTSPKAQQEIRDVANQMLEIATRYCPNVFKCLSETKENEAV